MTRVGDCNVKCNTFLQSSIFYISHKIYLEYSDILVRGTIDIEGRVRSWKLNSALRSRKDLCPVWEPRVHIKASAIICVILSPVSVRKDQLRVSYHIILVWYRACCRSCQFAAKKPKGEFLRYRCRGYIIWNVSIYNKWNVLPMKTQITCFQS